MDWGVWRRRWLTEPLYRRARNSVAPLTAFQRHVVAAGDPWWESQLLSGTPDWNALTYVRPPVLAERERRFLDGPVAILCRRLEEARNADERVPASELWRLLKDHRFEGMAISVDHGGLGIGAWAQSEVLRRIALRSVSTAYLVAARFVYGPAGLLRVAATPEQQQYWLPRLADGRQTAAVASFAVENDIVPIQATGVVVPGGPAREDAILRLNWRGARHAPGPRPGLLILPFRLHDPDGVLGMSGEGSVCVALLDTSAHGVTHHPGSCTWADPSRQPTSLHDGRVKGDTGRGGVFDGRDVQMPISCLLGGPDATYRGVSALMAAQLTAKGVALPALSSASVSLAAHASSAVMQLQGDACGREMLGARTRLGRLAATAYRVEAARRFLAAGIDLGYRPVLTAALLDIVIFEDVRRSIGDSMDLLGNAGATPALTEWQENLHELLPALFGLDSLAAHGRHSALLALGIMRVHPYWMQELEALECPDTDAGCQAFDRLAWKHIGHTLGILSQATGRAWTAGRFSPCPRLLGPVAGHYRRINRYAAAVALLVEVLQPGVRPPEIRSEPGLERLLKALAELVTLSAVLKRWQDDGRHDGDLPLLEWCASDAFRTVETLLGSILENLAMPGAGSVLKGLLMPPVQAANGPEDAVTLACAELLLVPSDTRERLVGSVWASHGLRHLGALERAYECVVNIHGLREQIRQAGLKDWRVAHVGGGLTSAQAEALEAAEKAVITALRGEEAPG